MCCQREMNSNERSENGDKYSDLLHLISFSTPTTSPGGGRENISDSQVLLWIPGFPEEWVVRRGVGEMSRKLCVTRVVQAQAAGVSEDSRSLDTLGAEGAVKERSQAMKSVGGPGCPLHVPTLFPAAHLPHLSSFAGWLPGEGRCTLTSNIIHSTHENHPG